MTLLSPISEVGLRRDPPTQPLFETVRLSKEFPGVQALKEVDFDLFPGEAHVLFGENGAGKSTLISIIAGAYQQTSGEMKVDDKPVRLNSVKEGRELGISAVFQEFSLIPQMTVEESLFLGSEITNSNILNKKAMRKRAAEILEDLNFDLPLTKRINELTRAEQQMVEIAKAFRSNLKILILDEPTASLTNYESIQLFKIINNLKRQDIGIIYITHRIGEIREIGDRITVLRDGIVVDTVDAQTTSEPELVRLMVGRVVGEIFPKIDFNPGKPLLEVNHLYTANQTVRDVSIHVRKGEIVGLAGLVGSGKSDFAQACFGANAISSGTVKLGDEDVTRKPIRLILNHGMLYLPADRRTDGLLMMRSMRENISLASISSNPVSNGWLLDKRSELEANLKIADRLNLLSSRLEVPAEHFSGGNQQKVMLARSLTREFSLFILDEPTVGVDVGTRIAIYQFIAELVKRGAGVLLISSDLPEILNLTARVYVFYRSEIQAELAGSEITEENVLSNYFEKEVA